VAYRAGVAVRADRFLADALQIAAALPPAGHILNLCKDRYRFAVSFAACLIGRRISLLPPSLTPQVIRQLSGFATEVACITDNDAADIDLPLLQYPQQSTALASWQCPQIAADQVAACLFTSGSTGAPQPHLKTWGRLASSVRAEARRFGLLDGRAHSVIATVPPQHMFGFESTVLLPLQSGNALHADRPFHPAEVCALLATAPRPRVLVSTPVHLRALLAADTDLPGVDLVVSSTAPLSQSLARDVESRFGTVLMEIYGSTETGQIATRRTAHTEIWQLYEGVTLASIDDRCVAQGAHIEQATPISDELEILDSSHFVLRGRSADMVNIAGKRSSLAYLNHHLLTVPGVVDGAFVLREESLGQFTGVSRVAAVVVAPGLDAAGVMAQLRSRIDSVFLPRPLLFVDKLPRNETGKLPQQALLELVAGAVSGSASE